MLNIRGLITVSVLSPFIIASTLGFALTACAPKSRFRPPVNVGGLGAPDNRTMPTVPTDGTSAVATLSPAEREKLRQVQAEKLGDGSTEESKEKLETSGDIAKLIEAIEADVNIENNVLVVRITNQSEVEQNGKVIPKILEFSGSFDELITDTTKKSIELTPVGEASAVKANLTIMESSITGTDEQKSKNIILGLELTGYGPVPLLVTLNADNGLSVVRLNDEGKVQTADPVTSGAVASSTISASNLPNSFSRISTTIQLSKDSTILSGGSKVSTNGATLTVVGPYEENAKLNVSVEGETLKGLLSTEGHILKLPSVNPEAAQEGIMLEIPYADKTGSLKLAIGTADNIAKLTAEAVVPAEADPTVPADTATEAAEAPAKSDTPADTATEAAEAPTKSDTPAGATTAATPSAPVQPSSGKVTGNASGSADISAKTDASEPKTKTEKPETAAAKKITPTQFIYHRVGEVDDSDVTYYLYKIVELQTGTKCYVQRTRLNRGDGGEKSLKLGSYNERGRNAPVWTSPGYISSSEEAFSFDRDDWLYWDNQEIASFTGTTPGSEKLNVYVRDEDSKFEHCTNTDLEKELAAKK